MPSPLRRTSHAPPAYRSETADGLSFFHDYAPPTEDFLQDVIDGLSSDPKSISPKYFYDETGSRLFDAICETEEYYPTRTEIGLLGKVSAEIAELTGKESTVVEFGSGSSVKIRQLLDALEQPTHYIALDISKDHLKKSAQKIARTYPEVLVGGICADFTAKMPIPSTDQLSKTAGRRLGFLPGSTIGNFHPRDAELFLQSTLDLLGPSGAFVIGVDLKKDHTILNAAYNDASGVTAQFNLNLLRRMNRELDAVIDEDAFEHQAFYNADAGRIEMHLKSQRQQVITIGDRRFSFEADETIHTENSYKYRVEEFSALARKAGFQTRRVWTDENNLFSVHFLEAHG